MLQQNIYRRFASTLVLAEHKNGKLVGNLFNTLSAMPKISSSNPVTVLVAANAAHLPTLIKSLSTVGGISKILCAVGDNFLHPTAEDLTPVLLAAQKQFNFSHLVAAHSTFGKNLMPRVASILDVAQISDVMDIKSEDTFVRPIYAGSH